MGSTIKPKRWAMALLLFLFVLCSGCGGDIPVLSPVPSDPVPEPLPDPLREQLDVLTTEQKIAQLLVAGIEGTVCGVDAVAAVKGYQVGGVILFARNVESTKQLMELTSSLKRQNGDYIPLLLCVDEEGGRVSRMPSEVVKLPAAYSLRGKGKDYFTLGGLLGAECRLFDLNMDFAPALDIWSNPNNTVIGNRAYGSEWKEVADAGTEVMRGIMAAGVTPVVKHFPGHGDTVTDSHYGLPVVSQSLAELRERELRPFQAAIEAGAPAVMVGHILVTELDAVLPASLSPRVVSGLLREEMGFGGVVCTDDLTMGAVSDTYGMGEAVVLAVEAGCDLLLVCHKAENLQEAYEALCAAVDSGRISRERLDESAYRILALKAVNTASAEQKKTPVLEEVNAQIHAFTSR